MEKKILVVDDSKTIRDMFHAIFVRNGYHIRMAENAEDAIGISKRESIMVTFLDLELPGISGIDFCKKLREEGHMGFVFAITGRIDTYGLMQCRCAGFDDYFPKPFSLDVVTRAADQAFEKLERWKEDKYSFF